MTVPAIHVQNKDVSNEGAGDSVVSNSFLKKSFDIPDKYSGEYGDWAKRPGVDLLGEGSLVFHSIQTDKGIQINPYDEAAFKMVIGESPRNVSIIDYYANPEQRERMTRKAKDKGFCREDVWFNGADGRYCFDMMVFCKGDENLCYRLAKLVKVVRVEQKITSWDKWVRNGRPVG